LAYSQSTELRPGLPSVSGDLLDRDIIANQIGA
jgi:hypothetical protein